jgi:hypothetical protein
MDKEIAQENMEDELEVYVGRPYSGEHNKIPKSKQSEKEEETKEEKEEGDQEPETKAEVIRRTEDPIGTKETDNSPVFDIKHHRRFNRTKNRNSGEEHRELPRLEQYERQTISIDPTNFIEVMKEEIRKHKRNRTRTEGAPHKKQADEEREHNQLPLRGLNPFASAIFWGGTWWW